MDGRRYSLQPRSLTRRVKVTCSFKANHMNRPPPIKRNIKENGDVNSTTGAQGPGILIFPACRRSEIKSTVVHFKEAPGVFQSCRPKGKRTKTGLWRSMGMRKAAKQVIAYMTELKGAPP